MTAQSKSALFKPGYQGAQPQARLTPDEVAPFDRQRLALVRRLHDAMLVLSTWDEHRMGSASSWPQYVREFSDLIGWDPADQPAPQIRFDPTPEQQSDALKAMELLEGVRRVYQQVLFLRAIGEKFGGWSFATIGETYERSAAWAQQAYDAVLIQAARRCGILDAEPRGHAILVAALNVGGWRTNLAMAADPDVALRQVRVANALGLDEAFVFWVAGRPVAERLIKTARAKMRAHQTHGSWYLRHPDFVAEALISSAQEIRAAWSIEDRPVLRLSGGGPRLTIFKESMRSDLDGVQELRSKADELSEEDDAQAADF